MESSNRFLGTRPVGKLMGRYAVPCIISLPVLTALYLLFQTPLIPLFGGTVNEQTFVISHRLSTVQNANVILVPESRPQRAALLVSAALFCVFATKSGRAAYRRVKHVSEKREGR